MSPENVSLLIEYGALTAFVLALGFFARQLARGPGLESKVKAMEGDWATRLSSVERLASEAIDTAEKARRIASRRADRKARTVPVVDEAPIGDGLHRPVPISQRQVDPALPWNHPHYLMRGPAGGAPAPRENGAPPRTAAAEPAADPDLSMELED